MNILLIGGTGNISSGIIKALLQRFGDSAKISVFNRGQSDDRLPPHITRLHGDRNLFPAFESQFASTTWDAVIDMICFKPDQAASDLRAFAGKTAHFIFCSTVCTYGNTQTIIPTPESTPQAPHSEYAKNKLACEQFFLNAYRTAQFKNTGLTIFRPSHTIGPGMNLHGQLGWGAPTFVDRIRKGLPVIISGDGHGLWQCTSSDNVGLGFAYAIGRKNTFGEAYNIASDIVTTWDQFTQNVASALSAPPPTIIHLPSDLLLAIDPERYAGVRNIFQYHGVYWNAKIHRDIPEFQELTPFSTAVQNTVAWMESQGRLKPASSDPHEQKLIDLYRAFSQSTQKSLPPKPSA